MTKQELSEKLAEIEEFLAEAFCIDGKVKMVSDEFMSSLEKYDAGWFQLNDSKRGTFYIQLARTVKAEGSKA
jgi:hypothetical protein